MNHPLHAALIGNLPNAKRLGSWLIKELNTCSEFQFFVAFITKSGIAAIKEPLLRLEKQGVHGKILTSDYLNFTEVEALNDLLTFRNLEVKILEGQSMHSKHFAFMQKKQFIQYIGSSNWTANAFKSNIETNVRIASPMDAKIAEDAKQEFEYFFRDATHVTKAWIANYAPLHFEARKSRKYLTTHVRSQAAETSDSDPITTEFKPNSMQKEALQKLHEIRSKGERKALIVSATGTGKTFLSAFDAAAFGAAKLLFVVHRENIARVALKSYQAIFGKQRTMGLYTGGQRTNADFVFGTIQTLSRENHLQSFPPDHFDYIIVDESHRAGATGYRKFLDHFQPRFLLGMTATPERTDGHDIYSLFDHNLAYEIRLNRALDEGLLCPFHYYGISDILIDGAELGDQVDFNQLISGQRVNHIVEAARRYGTYNDQTRGLIFCSRVEEAEGLAKALSDKGIPSKALTGETPEAERETAILLLESDSAERVQYLVTVDIFNEGIDIPCVNQILLLRPTQSAIVFVQQLGRGLRLNNDPRKYLTVIDFIANYKNNFLIPVALYGDRTFNKDHLRQLVNSGSDQIPGTSTIQFDEITRKRIFNAINGHSDRLKELREDWNDMRMRLGRTPKMMDFIEFGGRHPFTFAEYSKAGSYRGFLSIVDPDGFPRLPESLHVAFATWAKDALNGSSIEEPALLLALLKRGTNGLEAKELESAVRSELPMNWKYSPSKQRLASALNSISLGFLRVRQKSKLVPVHQRYQLSPLIQSDTNITAQLNSISNWNQMQLTPWLTDMAHAALQRAISLGEPLPHGLVVGAKYSRSDVFRILGSKVNPVAQNVGGYQIQDDSWCPIFVTYHKSEDISTTTQYEDAFTDKSTMRWFTKSNRSLTSPDTKFFIRAATDGNEHLPLFVKKSDDEGTTFYYCGDTRPDASSFIQQKMPNGRGGFTNVVEMKLKLGEPLEELLFDFLTSDL